MKGTIENKVKWLPLFSSSFNIFTVTMNDYLTENCL